MDAGKKWLLAGLGFGFGAMLGSEVFGIVLYMLFNAFT